ncbi:helix-turn-helix domain-containing protein [Alcanivorax sp. JB21]|uniref:GlxA family transcriptional regulator n=1 Tax=Alcanivorax limicola TaxID=2874102 RepID=UPI001CBF7FB8|nr:helix-turn-helix domain-containing protein [Alcanivorax limicola]MBZ2190352.1 helix-turn-helix domain-containing protein [Alcanivorax limicola]
MKIGLVIYPDCLPAGLFAFSDLLLAANLRLGRRRFSFCWLSEPGGDIATANGLTLPTEPLADATVDAVLVPGAWRDRSTAMAATDKGLVQALKALPRSTRYWSYCTGVMLVASTGRLDNAPATTTWWLRELAGQAFPAVQWRPHETLVYASPHATASGVSGYLPLALAILEAECGAPMVADIRRHMVLPRPEGKQTPLQDVPTLIQRGGWLRTLIQHIETMPATELDTAKLATAMNTSPRTLQRRVLEKSGYSCGKLMRLVKMNQVGEQLISTERPVAVIAHGLGFADEASLRRSFRQVAGMTPGQYRKRG